MCTQPAVLSFLLYGILKEVLGWQVLTAMEAKFKNSKYGSLHVKGVLGFDTESVPVQQFQARCADHILQSTRHPLSKVLLKLPLSSQSLSSVLALTGRYRLPQHQLACLSDIM